MPKAPAPAGPQKTTISRDGEVRQDVALPGTGPFAEGTSGAVTVDLRAEYLSGAPSWWSGAALRGLPWSIDDLTAAFGHDLYDRMEREPEVSANVTTFKAAILEDGVSLTTAVPDKDAEGYELAAELVDVVGRMLGDLEPDLDTVLWDMLRATTHGNRLAELTYEVDSTYAGTEQLVLRAMHVKPYRSYVFVVDAYRRLVGVLGMIPGTQQPVVPAALVLSKEQLANMLPLDKVFILTNRMTDNDPRGTSMLQSAYDPWWRKQQLKGEHLRYMSLYAIPGLAGFTPTKAQPRPATDANGNVIPGQFVTPGVAMKNALIGFRNSSILVLPDGGPEGSKLQLVEARGDGQAFFQTFTRCDHEIARSITTQVLAGSEAQHGTRAQAGVHKDVQDTLGRQGKKFVANQFRRQVLRRWVAYNYGPDALRLTPVVSLGETEHEDKAKMITAFGTVGYTLDESQFPGIDASLSLPERTAADTVEIDEADTVVEPAPTPAQPDQSVPPPPPPPPGTQPAQPARKQAA